MRVILPVLRALRQEKTLKKNFRKNFRWPGKKFGKGTQRHLPGLRHCGIENQRGFTQSLPMKLVRIVALCVAAVVCGGGCERAPAPPPVNTGHANDIRQAQPALRTMKLWLGSEELTAELALTPDQQRVGMMFRTSLAENAGMLFVFPVPHRASFWMKNTPLPLSVAYINPDGVILEIHDLQPHNTNMVVATSDRVQFVLETNQNWFERHNIRPGTVVRTEQGTLMETFQRRR
jgi:uncharacterized protein